MTDLTKWPRLLVSGEQVTREQANDILIRTNPPYLIANDKALLRVVAAEFGVPIDENGEADYRASREVFERLGFLRLGYLHNDRILSPWIGGPRGWCDWDGRIGTSNYNIGKYPTREAVHEDLVAIAKTWPFLQMHVQLLANEGEGELVAMWIVGDGRAVYVEPGEPLPRGAELSEEDVLRRLLPGGEGGFTVERLREAVRQVRASAGGR
ncbi:hypothetical protein [Actinomadura nitritigenes]|uniref:hypothetical protein n=1 Tax=Actinomadura nitritigenes TaxID=134602 RepID=UPI003D927BE1